MNDTDPPMQIGEVAERTGMSVRTLRHYDDVGLLQPSARSEGGFRLYAEADVERLLVIRRMKPLGFSLEEMLDVMRTVETLDDATADHATARAKLAETLADARERRARLERQLAMADEFIGILERHLP